jgi:hypothetical protein
MRRRVLRLACAGRQIADAATGEQHFDQERQQRADREEKREPEGDEQRNLGLIAKRAHERLRLRETWRSLPSPHHDGGVEDVRALPQIGQARLQPAPLDALGRFQLLAQRIDAIGHACGARRKHSQERRDARKQGSVRPGSRATTLWTLSNPSMNDHRANERLGFEQTFSETSIEAAKAGITVTLYSMHFLELSIRRGLIIASVYTCRSHAIAR